ncbi:MAG: hypothetical protein KIS84_07170 [Dokdonella sp.]|nr:hypothetical protein [Dokdonella sp.]
MLRQGQPQHGGCHRKRAGVIGQPCIAAQQPVQQAEQRHAGQKVQEHVGQLHRPEGAARDEGIPHETQEADRAPHGPGFPLCQQGIVGFALRPIDDRAEIRHVVEQRRAVQAGQVRQQDGSEGQAGQQPGWQVGMGAV